MFKNLQTSIYRAADLERAKAWYSDILGIPPYFDEPFYVGFRVEGYELRLQPDPGEGLTGRGGAVAYWGVDDIEAVFERLTTQGATAINPVRDVGGSIKGPLSKIPSATRSASSKIHVLQRCRLDDSRRQVREEAKMTQRASGTFEVDLKPQPLADEAASSTLGRLSLDKRFSGDLTAVSKGEMLSAGTNTEGSAAYVAIESHGNASWA